MPNNSFLRRYGAQIAARDGWICHYCGIALIAFGEEADPGPYEQIGKYRASIGKERAVVDHKTPQQHRFWVQETHTMENLVLACRLCNQRKKNKPYEQFAREIATWCQHYGYPMKG
jgi:hypothetical protein